MSHVQTCVVIGHLVPIIFGHHFAALQLYTRHFGTSGGWSTNNANHSVYGSLEYDHISISAYKLEVTTLSQLATPTVWCVQNWLYVDILLSNIQH